jgi:dolichol-phosphate mannosyltransferase
MNLSTELAEMERQKLTIICPVFNEAQGVNYFYERLSKVRDGLIATLDVDLIFINNASTDETLSRILALRAHSPWVQVITQARNFGYQASVLCGIKNASADAYVVIDADCEDPPEMIPIFIEKWREGYDLVYGRRDFRPESRIIVAARKVFYRLTHAIADSEFILDMAEFSLFSDRIRGYVLGHRSTFPFVRSDLAYPGFRRFPIPYTREPRRYGKTNYNLFGMARFAIAGMLSASTFPLRLLAYLGLPLALIDVLCGILTLLRQQSAVSALLLLNVGFLVGAAAFIAIYLARVTKDIVGRPVFVVDENLSHTNELLNRTDDNGYIYEDDYLGRRSGHTT